MEQRTKLLKAMQEMMKTQIDFLASRMDANQAEIRTIQARADALSCVYQRKQGLRKELTEKI
jgi:hypothetical protein